MSKYSYSYHDVDSGMGPAGKGWVVIREETDEHGDVIDTDMVRFFKTEAPARKLAAQLNSALSLRLEEP